MVLLEDATVFVVGRRADALQLAGGQGGLVLVLRIEGAAFSRAEMDALLPLAEKGITDLMALLQQSLLK